MRNKRFLTKSMNDILNIKTKSKNQDHSATVTEGFLKKPIEKEQVLIQSTSIKCKKELDKLAQIVSKVNSFKYKININEKNIEDINKLLITARKTNNIAPQTIKNLVLKQKQQFDKNLSNKILDSIVTKPVFKKDLSSLKQIKPKQINKLNIKRNSFSDEKNKNLVSSARFLLMKTQSDLKTFVYYMTLMNYFIKYPNDNDYFNLIYREHFLQSLAAYNFCSSIQCPSTWDEKKNVKLGENPKSK